ncbi:hypothetical protein BO71DRAFT_203046 [Aspergillus ellipticus CBS 707.79]|uniref:Uncharacterized protein n=1 Tax=Aspergillus ellipticus CBS 707.79 TaxID=1448320 RepID=A0A319DVP7_9EURO|nr:hypothetical protein BO71DRAFT_203046 [Aspergillus ellipticus CBS 707.79]
MQMETGQQQAAQVTSESRGKESKREQEEGKIRSDQLLLLLLLLRARPSGAPAGRPAPACLINWNAMQTTDNRQQSPSERLYFLLRHGTFTLGGLPGKPTQTNPAQSAPPRHPTNPRPRMLCSSRQIWRPIELEPANRIPSASIMVTVQCAHPRSGWRSACASATGGSSPKIHQAQPVQASRAGNSPDLSRGAVSSLSCKVMVLAARLMIYTWAVFHTRHQQQ